MNSTRKHLNNNTDLAGDLRRTFEREERRRARMVRTLAVAGVGVLLVVALVAVGLTMPALRPSAAAASASDRLQTTGGLSASRAPQVGARAIEEVPPATPEPDVSPKEADPAPETSAPETTQDPAPRPALKRKAVAKSPARTTKSPSPQRFKIAIGDAGYEPSRITAKADSPITLTVGKGEGCAAGFTIPELGVNADNSSGSVTVRLGKLKSGSYTYMCAMGMVSGELVVR
jgi:heme/copper-type cytochrome/quinol oxidase subunit 2